MHFHYDILLLSFSILASTLATYFALNLIGKLYTSPANSRRVLLPSFSIATGTGIWLNQILLSVALSPNTMSQRNMLSFMTLMAWIFAVIIAVTVFNTSSKRSFRLTDLFLASILAGLSIFGMFYFDSASASNILDLKLTSFDTLFTILFTIGASNAMILLFAWSKSYGGKNILLIKVVTALLITLCITTIHFVLYQTFNHMGIANNENSDIYTQLMGIVIALALVSLFLLLFIFVIFFEKYGSQIFTFSLLNAQKAEANDELATVDNLTKLPNRRAFEKHLESVAKTSNRFGTMFALAYIDLDHFKPINDHFGHHVGDEALRVISNRISSAMRGCDFVARIGGDEFVAIIEDIKLNEDIIPIVNRVLKSVAEEFTIKDYPIHLSCSIGISVYPDDGDIKKLGLRADAAMYKAKESGKNQFKFYDAEIESSADKLLEMQRDLSNAIDNKEFSLLYLPKLNCKTQKLTGVEALIRWQHPTKGEIMPDTFLATAERFSMMNEISDWITDECCRTILAAKKIGVDLKISINLSNQQFRNPNLLVNILKSIKYHEVDSSSLSFEIKETIALSNQEQFKRVLNQFKASGLNISIDDFGMHPISLSYLQDLVVNELKLDKSFVWNISENKSSTSLIQAIIQLAHALNLRVVAEGVETETQRDALVDLGCDEMQGFLFSIPLTYEELPSLYKRYLA